MYCTKDARKVFVKYPELVKDQLQIEMALEYAFPRNFMQLYKKNEFDIQKTVAMCRNRYFKNVDREIDTIEWDTVLSHYFFLLSNYLDADCNYNDLITLNSISKFDTNQIVDACNMLKIKNLFYLRKVLENNKNIKKVDIEYKKIEEKRYIVYEKGEKIDIEGVMNNEQFRYY